jgi:hypothetical protein
VVLASIVRGIDARYLGSELHSADDGFPRLAFIIGLLAAGVIWGLVLASFNWIRLVVSNKVQLLQFIAPDVQSIWAKVNGTETADWAVVFTDADDNDFLLSRAKRLNEDGSLLYEVDGQGVYLNTRNVKRVEFVKGA